MNRLSAERTLKNSFFKKCPFKATNDNLKNDRVLLRMWNVDNAGAEIAVALSYLVSGISDYELRIKCQFKLVHSRRAEIVQEYCLAASTDEMKPSYSLSIFIELVKEIGTRRRTYSMLFHCCQYNLMWSI